MPSLKAQLHFPRYARTRDLCSDSNAWCRRTLHWQLLMHALRKPCVKRWCKLKQRLHTCVFKRYITLTCSQLTSTHRSEASKSNVPLTASSCLLVFAVVSSSWRTIQNYAQEIQPVTEICALGGASKKLRFFQGQETGRISTYHTMIAEGLHKSITSIWIFFTSGLESSRKSKLT